MCIRDRSEVVYTDGQAYEPSNFGQTDTSTNRWVPKDVSGLTYGTNGYYLNFADSSAIGNDVSGQNNDWTNNNTVTQTTDSPTTNLSTLNPNDKASGLTLSNGNRTFANGTNRNVQSTLSLPSTGKYYWEVNLDTASSGSIGVFLALNGGTEAMTTATGSWGTAVALYRAANGNVYVDGTSIFTISGVSAINTTWQVAVDLDNNKMWFGINNTWMSSTAITGGNPSTGANPVLIRDFTGYKPLFGNYSNTMTVDFASANWGYTPPTGFVEFSQDNLAGTDQFQSAFSWIKNRDATDNHMLFDRVRGATNDIHSNTTDDQVTNVNTVQSFLEAGVQVGNDVQVNTANESYVLWNWMTEATGSGTLNEVGSIDSTVLVDTTLGMSVGTFTGTGNSATVGHGLGVAPQMILFKDTATVSNWAVYQSGLTTPATYKIKLNQDGAQLDGGAAAFNSTNPSSTVFTVNTDDEINPSSKTMLFIAFAPSQFISIGSYEGNANANGTFVPTVNSVGVPIQPVWVLTKDADTTGPWVISDTSRSPSNEVTKQLQPNLTTAEITSYNSDIDTGGFKWRASNSYVNGASTFIYIAIGTPIIDTDGRIIAGR